MTYEEALKTCEMALKPIGMSHAPQNNPNEVADIIKEISKKHDIETLMMCIEKQIPKKLLKKMKRIVNEASGVRFVHITVKTKFTVLL